MGEKFAADCAHRQPSRSPRKPALVRKRLKLCVYAPKRFAAQAGWLATETYEG